MNKISKKVISLAVAFSVSQCIFPWNFITTEKIYGFEKSLDLSITERADNSFESEKVSGESVLQQGGLLDQNEAGIWNKNFQEEYPTCDNNDISKLVLKSSSSTLEKVEKELMNGWDDLTVKIDLSKYKITKNELRSVYHGILNNEPRFFYVYGGYVVYSYGDIVDSVEVTYNYSNSQIKTMKKEYEAAVNEALKGARSDWSDVEKVLYVNDYLCKNCKYDSTLKKYTAYDVLVKEVAVCQGYALAFKELAGRLGVECRYVSSEKLNHAWNVVKVGGKYYHIDSTWNDPVFDKIGRVRHLYFLKSSSFFKSNQGGHVASDYVYEGGLKEQEVNDKTYDNYFWNKVDAGFVYSKGSWYGFDGGDTISKLNITSNKVTLKKAVVSIKDVWTTQGGGYYKDRFVCLEAVNSNLYYSTPQAVKSINVTNNKIENVYSLTSSQKKSGCIYGMNINKKGELRYLLASDYNSTGTIKKVEGITLLDNSSTSEDTRDDGDTNANTGNKDGTNKEDNATADNTSDTEKDKVQQNEIKPKKVNFSKIASRKKGELQLTWTGDSKMSGYEVRCSYNKSFSKKETESWKIGKGVAYVLTIKGFKSGKKVYAQVRSFVKTKDGKKNYSAWSSKKSIKVK